jgi:hypothetical protein
LGGLFAGLVGVPTDPSVPSEKSSVITTALALGAIPVANIATNTMPKVYRTDEGVPAHVLRVRNQPRCARRPITWRAAIAVKTETSNIACSFTKYYKSAEPAPPLTKEPGCTQIHNRLKIR